MLIRSEISADATALFDLHAKAFGSDAEARLVELLRARGRNAISLVAEFEKAVVGHVLFTPVQLETADGSKPGLGLGPVAVAAANRKQGIAEALIKAGIEQAEREGYEYIVVLGNPKYYGRFGFARASDLNIRNEYDADDAFMIMELKKKCVLPKSGGLIKYAPEFSEIGV